MQMHMTIQMRNRLLSGYRTCLKELIQLKNVDQRISDHFREVLRAMRGRRMFRKEKDAIVFLESFQKFMERVNNLEHKSVMKMLRLYTNTSKFCDSSLTFRPTFQSKAMERLPSDIQYKDLASKDQQFVLKVIERVCERKPKLKFKNVAIFLNSTNSQSSEPKVKKQQINQELYEYFTGHSKLQKFFDQLVIEDSTKMEKVIQEIYRKRIILI